MQFVRRRLFDRSDRQRKRTRTRRSYAQIGSRERARDLERSVNPVGNADCVLRANAESIRLRATDLDAARRNVGRRFLRKPERVVRRSKAVSRFDAVIYHALRSAPRHRENARFRVVTQNDRARRRRSRRKRRHRRFRRRRNRSDVIVYADRFRAQEIADVRSRRRVNGSRRARNFRRGPRRVDPEPTPLDLRRRGLDRRRQRRSDFQNRSVRRKRNARNRNAFRRQGNDFRPRRVGVSSRSFGFYAEIIRRIRVKSANNVRSAGRIRLRSLRRKAGRRRVFQRIRRRVRNAFKRYANRRTRRRGNAQNRRRKRNFRRRRVLHARPIGIETRRAVPDRFHANVIRRVRAQAGQRVRPETRVRFRRGRFRRKVRRRRVFQRVRRRVRNAFKRCLNRRRTQRGNAQNGSRKRRRSPVFVSAEVDRSVETPVPGKVGLERGAGRVDGVSVVSFVQRLRAFGERVIAVRRVFKERLRRVVGVVVRTGVPLRMARKDVVSFQRRAVGHVAADVRRQNRIVKGRRSVVRNLQTAAPTGFVRGERRVAHCRRSADVKTAAARSRGVLDDQRVRQRQISPNQRAAAPRRRVAGNRRVRNSRRSVEPRSAALVGRRVVGNRYVGRR